MTCASALHLFLVIVILGGFAATAAVADESSAPKMDSSAALQPGGERIAWTFTAGGPVWSSPALSDEIVYIGSDDHKVYALDAKTGAKKWAFETGGIVRCRPAIAEGIVYFTSDDCLLYSIDSTTGKEKWRANIGGADVKRILPDATGTAWDYMQSSPAVSGHLVYIGSADGTVYAVNAADGKEAWRFKTGDIVRSTPRIADGVLYVGSNDGFLYAIDAAKGTKIWQFDTRGKEWKAVTPTPIIVDGVCVLRQQEPLPLRHRGGDGQGEVALQLRRIVG